MSTRTTIKTELRDAKTVGEAAQTYLGDLLKAQEEVDHDIKVSFDSAATQVKMHGRETAKVNGGVLSFSDSEYQVGFNTDSNGDITLVYDSWVSGGLMTRRMNGNDLATQREVISKGVQERDPAGNLKDCLNMHKLATSFKTVGKRVRHRVHQKRLQAFVAAR